MLGDGEVAAGFLRRAADEYATSLAVAPPRSWGRLLAMLRCRLMARDEDGGHADAVAALAAGALGASGPIGGYCAALVLLVLGRDDEALPIAERIADEGLDPPAVANALAALARGDTDGYGSARREVLRSFEERDAFLEDVPVADTVLVLDALAGTRGVAGTPLASPLLPSVDLQGSR
jgi:hypothetical protein